MNDTPSSLEDCNTGLRAFFSNFLIPFLAKIERCKNAGVLMPASLFLGVFLSIPFLVPEPRELLPKYRGRHKTNRNESSSVDEYKGA